MLGNNTKIRIPEALWSNDRFGLKHNNALPHADKAFSFNRISSFSTLFALIKHLIRYFLYLCPWIVEIQNIKT